MGMCETLAGTGYSVGVVRRRKKTGLAQPQVEQGGWSKKSMLDFYIDLNMVPIRKSLLISSPSNYLKNLCKFVLKENVYV